MKSTNPVSNRSQIRGRRVTASDSVRSDDLRPGTADLLFPAEFDDVHRRQRHLYRRRQHRLPAERRVHGGQRLLPEPAQHLHQLRQRVRVHVRGRRRAVRLGRAMPRFSPELLPFRPDRRLPSAPV